MFTTEVNEYALATAANLVVGEEALARITALYQVIDKAMFAGYELGKEDGLRNFGLAVDESFDNGWELGDANGSASCMAMEAQGYDEGYLDGVSDARARPALADDTVCDIINEMTQQAINGEVDGGSIDDEGDEEEYCAECGIVHV